MVRKGYEEKKIETRVGDGEKGGQIEENGRGKVRFNSEGKGRGREGEGIEEEGRGGGMGKEGIYKVEKSS